jgi:hypothetical protein
MATAPTVHLNGTGGVSLIEQRRATLKALRAAREALAEMSPHGRDYYTQEAGALGLAIKQHEARMDSILQLEREISEELGEVIAQIPEPKPLDRFPRYLPEAVELDGRLFSGESHGSISGESEASTVGLKPGQWPERIKLSDSPEILQLVMFELDRNGDARWADYRSIAGGRVIRIYND